MVTPCIRRTRSRARHTQAGTPRRAHARPVAATAARCDAPATSERADTTGPPPGGMRLPKVLAAHLGSEQVSRVVYGTVIGLALVVALEAHPPTAIATATTIVTTAVAVALAELYSEVVGVRVRLRTVPKHHRGAMIADVLAVAAGAGFPAVFFILAAAGALKLDTAFTIAKWSGLGLIALYGYWAARLGGASNTRSLVYAGAVALIGAFVIALKALVH